VNLYLAFEQDIENWNNSKSASETNPGIIAKAIKKKISASLPMRLPR